MRGREKGDSLLALPSRAVAQSCGPLPCRGAGGADAAGPEIAGIAKLCSWPATAAPTT